MEQPLPFPKEIIAYLPVLILFETAMFAFLLVYLFDMNTFSVEGMTGIITAKYGLLFLAIALLGFLFVAFISGKAFKSGGQADVGFASAAFASCNLPAILGFSLAFLNKAPSLYFPFAALTVLYVVYVFSRSKQSA